VLNVASEITDPNLSTFGITQAKSGLVDWDDPNNEAKVQASMDLLDRWYGQGNILVHCQGGRNRTLYVLSRWWARRTGQGWQAVAEQIKKVRPEMALHGWMLKQGGNK
jgi:protein-tyrosine phosphatase